MENTKSLILGTAMWAWTVNREECFHLLDDFYEAGFRMVDTATNYPINKNIENFRAAENILLEWITAHDIKDLAVSQKVGSLNNLHTSEHNLSKSFLLLNLDDYRHRFGNNLHTFMIHWDNRSDREAIRGSLEVLQNAVEHGIHAGLSGIKHPEIYQELNEILQLDFIIQIKHNLLQSDYGRYQGFHGKAQFLAYGMNAGGMKLDPKTYNQKSSIMARGGPPVANTLPKHLKERMQQWNSYDLPLPITHFNQLGMINAYHHPGISGLIIGPSNSSQLRDSIEFYRLLQTGTYEDIYRELPILQ